MSKYKLARMLRKELKKVNNEIDRRIVEGRSYEAWARRHKSLLSQLRHINEYAAGGVLNIFSLI